MRKQIVQKQNMATRQNFNTSLWFRRKLYGWGWYPATWQGWLVIVLFFLAEALTATVITGLTTNDADFAAYFSATTFGLVLILIIISWKKGETPRWQWGGR